MPSQLCEGLKRSCSAECGPVCSWAMRSALQGKEGSVGAMLLVNYWVQPSGQTKGSGCCWASRDGGERNSFFGNTQGLLAHDL